MHRFVKRSEVFTLPVLDQTVRWGASPQDTVDRDRVTWAAIWERFAGRTSAPWRQVQLCEQDFLPRPTDEEMTMAANFLRGYSGRFRCFLSYLAEVALNRLAPLHCHFLPHHGAAWFLAGAARLPPRGTDTEAHGGEETYRDRANTSTTLGEG